MKLLQRLAWIFHRIHVVVPAVALLHEAIPGPLKNISLLRQAGRLGLSVRFELVRKEMTITTAALAVVGYQPSDGAIAQATLLSQPQEECLCIATVADGCLYRSSSLWAWALATATGSSYRPRRLINASLPSIRT